jgi:hypothetical protein
MRGHNNYAEGMTSEGHRLYCIVQSLT